MSAANSADVGMTIAPLWAQRAERVDSWAKEILTACHPYKIGGQRDRVGAGTLVQLNSLALGALTDDRIWSITWLTWARRRIRSAPLWRLRADGKVLVVQPGRLNELELTLHVGHDRDEVKPAFNSIILRRIGRQWRAEGAAAPNHLVKCGM